MRNESLAFLTRLLNTPSPSSQEVAGQRIWLDYVKPFADSVETDTYGNAIATINAGATPKIMVEGHADEIGYQVQYIDDAGFLYVAGVGGNDPALASGQRVNIHSAQGTVFGVIGALAIHMQDRSKKGDGMDVHDIVIDIGAENRADAEKRVCIGDMVTYAVGFEQLNGNIYVARAADNRIGTFVAAEVMRLVSESRSGLKASLVAVSAIGEENGLYGAEMIGYSIKPDAALVVDVGHATDIPIANKKKFGDVKLGKGAILSKGSLNHPVLLERVRAVAETNSIPVQKGIDPRRSGTDADAIALQRGGIATISIGVPNRYMHTPVEAVHLDDLENLARLLSLVVLDMKPDEAFKVKI